jgi:MoxR-like ATPase
MEDRLVVNEIIHNVEKVIMGKTKVIELALIGLLAEGHVLLEDVPGVGKTSLANALAKSINLGFTRIQFTPDTLPSDITGVSVYNMQTLQFEYHKGPIFNNIILADEINRTSPKTQASLLEAMEERQISMDGNTYELPSPFMVIATQNPIDYLGTYNLPEAQLDRFLMKLSIGYPAIEDERNMITSYMERNPMATLQPVTNGAMITKLQEEVNKVKIHKDLIQYILNIVNATREDSSLTLGASPRATLALIRATRSAAYVAERNYAIPDDILKMLEPVLLHRLILSPEARINKLTTTKVLTKIRSKYHIPIL